MQYASVTEESLNLS